VRRVPPSTVIREEIDQLLRGGVGARTNIISTLADLGLRYIAQHALGRSRKTFSAEPTTSVVTTPLQRLRGRRDQDRRGRGRAGGAPGQRGR
jgi:hypothetical protein